MMETYTFKLLTIDNLSALNLLFNAAFNNTIEEEFLRWKYFSNPAGNAVLAGAFFEDKLVGSGAMIPEMMNVLNKEELVFKCTDLMTHPDHQRKGLSKKINELLIKTTNELKAPFLYTLCSNISTMSFIRNNWSFIDHAVNFFKPALLLKLNYIFSNKDFKDIRFYDTIGDELINYNYQVNPAKISVKKSSDYLKWRTSNPNFKYKIICHYNQQNHVNGYLIYSISANNLLNIIDLESSEENSKIVSKLIKSAEYIAVKNKHKGILIMAIKDSNFFKYIQSRCYLRNPFDKGPLKTILDFNIFLHDKSFNNISAIDVWNIYGLSYDDI